MSITDELTNMVNPHILTGLQTQHIYSPTPTCNILSGFLRMKMGAAGNGVSITDLTEMGDGRFYRGLDTAENRRSNEGTVQHYEQWTNLQEDIVLAGTQLQEVLGMNTSQVVAADSSLTGFSEDDRLTFINLAAMRGEQAAVSGMADVDRALWGDYIPGDNPSRMPITLDEVFDETGRLHGIGPEDLGQWEPGKQVWGEDPPNSKKNKNRHIPQIFENAANPGTARNIGYRLLLEANVRMSANVNGFWVCPLHPDLFLKLDNEMFQAGDTGGNKVPLYAGAKWEYRIECIRIQNSFYYVEQRAPKDRARHIHIGQMDGTGGSFFPFAWMPKESTDLLSLLTSPDPTPTIPGVQMGKPSITWPWFTQEWTRSERYANAIFCELELKWMWLCTYRWKQFEVRDLM